jgi:N-acetylmuramoyl-L-alanine amidase
MSNPSPAPSAPAPTPPVGSGDYIVKEGDCICSIAEGSGHFWETIWNEPANAELKNKRADPNVLLPGDKVTVPPLREKQESVASEQHHKFKRKGVPSKLRLQLLNGTEPRANLEYRLDVDGDLRSGSTDGDGYIDEWIPGTARSAILFLTNEDGEEERFELALGHTEPADSFRGVQQRLLNLGFDVTLSGALDPATIAALADFQAANGLTVTGEADKATKDKLKEVHGI